MKCNLCPRCCNVDRQNAKGYCQSSSTLKIAKYCLFCYEEPCISVGAGSGAIFFCGCTLRCVFCQNYEISSQNTGAEITVQDLCKIFKDLEKQGAKNINLVNPTHYVSEIVEALKMYRPNIPIIYNTHSYEKIETLQMLAPYVDVFLPDFKYFNNSTAKKYSNVTNYVEVTQNAILYMRKLKPDIFENGEIKQGVIVRHMIMPLFTNESIEILNWIKCNLGDTLVSLMSQYTPYARVKDYPEINRKITKREYKKVVDKFLELELDGFVQDMESADNMYIPSWDFKGF